MAMDIFIELSLIIAIATIISCIMYLLKQPLIIGYILTGILVSPYFLSIIKSTETIQFLSQIGIAFLLFVVGLTLSPKVIKEVGKISLLTGLGQVIFTSLIGFFIAKLLGFSDLTSLYISIALTFSSTIIIMKILHDKKDLEKLYARISIGFLLVQDLIAIFILFIITSFSNLNNSISNAIMNVFEGILLIIILIPITVYILPKLTSFFAKSQEFLFLFSIAWGLGISSLSYYSGFSLEIGALLAGISLSMSQYSYEISSRMKPLRDFFIIVFFILLGSQMVFGNIKSLLIPSIIFSLFILIGNPLILMVIMGILGYSKRVSFLVGLTAAQISEFSIILVALGVKLGHLSSEILYLITLVGLITITGSTYFMLYSDKLYNIFKKYLTIFEKKELRVHKEFNFIKYDVVLFGRNRIGYDIVKSFKKLKKSFLIVDYDPEVIDKLKKENLPCVYGDAEDDSFLDILNLEKVKMIISTMPDLDANLNLLRYIRERNKKIIFISVAHSISDAIELYANKASYVVLPHFLGGEYTSNLISKYGLKNAKFDIERKKHIESLKERIKEGHEHPIHEKDR